MMTDLEKLKELLDGFGVGFSEFEKNKRQIIRCSDGYSMFYTDFEFDEQGKFVTMGAWE